MEVIEETLFLGKKRASPNQSWVGIFDEDRRRHIYVVGQTGTGKTTFLTSCMIQDIQLGRGFAFIDPHGDSAEHIIDCIPKRRILDVVYFNPSDTEHPIGFNPFSGVPKDLQATATANLVAAFRSMWPDFWGPRMEHVLSNTIAALLACPQSYRVSILSIPQMLTDTSFRNRVLTHVEDPVTLNFWHSEFAEYPDRIRSEIISPILNKIGAFGRSPVLRNILCQPSNTFDLTYMMDNNKILVVNLSKGVIGQDMSNLLGSLLVCTIQQEAMKRATIPEPDRVDFHLYIDEFQNFTTDAFDSIVSEARKYRLSLVIAHQYLSQISNQIREAILGNVGNLVLFSLGGKDAELLAVETKPFTAQMLREQAQGNMLVRCIRNGKSADPIPIQGFFFDDRCGSKPRVINNCRRRFAFDRKVIEEKINKWLLSANM